MSDENSICIVVTVIAEQTFKIFSEDTPSDDQITKDFEAVKFTLDPAPPCSWKYELNSVHVDVIKEDNTVKRNFSVEVIINIDQSNFEFVKICCKITKTLAIVKIIKVFLQDFGKFFKFCLFTIRTNKSIANDIMKPCDDPERIMK